MPPSSLAPFLKSDPQYFGVNHPVRFERETLFSFMLKGTPPWELSDELPPATDALPLEGSDLHTLDLDTIQVAIELWREHWGEGLEIVLRDRNSTPTRLRIR